MNNVKTFEKRVEGEQWDKALHNAYKKKNKQVNIEGFRKGSAPYEVFVKKLGIETLYMDAVDIIIDDIFEDILNTEKITPVVTPKYDIESIDKDGVTFKFTIITKPEVTLGEYKNLGLKREKAQVTKEEIDEEIKKLQEQLAEIVPKENGKVEMQDTAVIDFEGFVDGKTLENGKSENYPLQIGSNSFIPGFEDGIIGMSINETKELNLKFPEDYVKDLSGKEVKFFVTLKEIKTRKVPEINEEFYQDLGYEDIKTEEEFRKEVKQVILDRKNAQIEDAFIDKCLEKAAENLKVEINEEIIDDEVHRMIHQFEDQLRMQGIKFEDYMKITGLNHEKLHEQMEPEATKRVKYRYLLEAIADVEKIDFTAEEVDKKTQEMADNYGISPEELLKAYGSNEVVKYDMKMHEALEILKNNN